MRIKRIQIDFQVQFLLQDFHSGRADCQMNGVAGGHQNFQQSQGIGHTTGARHGDDEILHDRYLSSGENDLYGTGGKFRRWDDFLAFTPNPLHFLLYE